MVNVKQFDEKYPTGMVDVEENCYLEVSVFERQYTEDGWALLKIIYKKKLYVKNLNQNSYF